MDVLAGASGFILTQGRGNVPDLNFLPSNTQLSSSKVTAPREPPIFESDREQQLQGQNSW